MTTRPQAVRFVMMLALLALAGCGWAGVSVPLSSGRAAAPPPVKPSRASALPTMTVTSGNTVYGIARGRNIAVRALIDANELRPPYVLKPGQRLYLPPPRQHVVKAGETIYGISRDYDIDVTSLVKANGLGPPHMIMVGQVLNLPVTGGRVTAATPPKGAGTAGSRSKPLGATPAIGPKPKTGNTKPVSKPRPRVASPPPRSGKSFLRPVRGRIISKFGVKPGGLHNDGINIAAKRGAPVRAAENGVVTYAGNELRGFGNLILIRHRGGWVTAYAHNEKLLVRRGQKVRRGQPVARVGSSGNVSRPQLHFELRRKRRAVNPQRYL